jgi:hypothetical protein
MVSLPGTVIQKFKPVVQNQLKPFMRPEEIPTSADCYGAADSTDEDLRRRRAAGQAGTRTQPVRHALPSSSASVAAQESTGMSPGNRLLISPEARALVSNVFRGAVNSAADAAREEAPRVAEDMGDKEYEKKRDKHRAKRFAGNAEKIYY